MNNYHQQTAEIQKSIYWQSGFKLLVIASIILLTGCAQTTPNLDSKFGEATRETFKQQIANPNAGNNSDPVKGIDGRAAHDAVDNYHKSFASPEKAQGAFDIGVGTEGNK